MLVGRGTEAPRFELGLDCNANARSDTKDFRTPSGGVFDVVVAAGAEPADEDLLKFLCKSAILAAIPPPIFMFLGTETLSSETSGTGGFGCFETGLNTGKLFGADGLLFTNLSRVGPVFDNESIDRSVVTLGRRGKTGVIGDLETEIGVAC